MKKAIATLILLFTINFCFAQFPETFDTEIPDSWATFIGENGEGEVQNWRHDANGYAISLFEIVFEESEDWLVTPRVAITEANKVLTFNFADLDDDNFGSVLEIRISTGTAQTNHSDFETVLSVSEKLEPGFSFFGAFVDLSEYVGQNIYVAFVHVQQSGDTFIVDDVDFIEAREPPLAVINPAPENNAENVPFQIEDVDGDGTIDEFIQFSWEVDESGGAPTSFDFSIGLSPETVEGFTSLPEDARALIFPNLRNNTTYYWAITPRNSGGVPEGGVPIWSFTTVSDPLSTDNFEKQIIGYFYNSATQELNISTQGSAFQKIVIYDYSGRQVHLQNLKKTKEKINLNSLSTGTYIAKVAINNKLQTFKFIKD